MKACPGCRRHVRAEARCPFCGSAQRETTAPTLAVVLGIAASVSGCGPRIEDNGAGSADGSTTDDATTSASTAGTVTAASTTGPGTTASPTTIDPGTTGAVDTGDVTTDFPTSVGFIYGSASTGVSPIECSTWDQDCPNGEKCMPWANDGGDVWNATRCSPVDPDPGAPGDPCQVEGTFVSGVDDCELGSMCWFVDLDTNQGTCVSLCEGAAQACPEPGTACLAHDDLFGVCLTTCDPLKADCPDDLECVAGPDGTSVCQ